MFLHVFICFYMFDCFVCFFPFYMFDCFACFNQYSIYSNHHPLHLMWDRNHHI